FQHALVISTQGDIGEVSAGLLRSLDPTFFIGVSTNALFAAVLVFVSSSAGAAPFAYPVACTASLMGVAVLLAIATYLRRLSFPPAVAAPASP
ncbi:MAG: hypothetical protein KGK34_13510, partial [Chloroflexota bacterium]|nr:hypothetical protein [Chloroflexota bacterium]